MSIIAGIYGRDENARLPGSLCDSLRSLVSRRPEVIREFKGDRTYFVKVDIGAFGSSGEKVDLNGGISLLAGEPAVLGSGRTERNRELDLTQIHDGFAAGNTDWLSRTRGVFCIANYQSATGVLTLATDKLGVRPLYYWFDDKYVVFSSALRVIEVLSDIRKTMNLRAVTEISGLGYALGDRTPYSNVFLLRAGEAIRFQGSHESRLTYWRWNEITPSSETEEALLPELLRRFDDAVALRLNGDTSTVAYLSGGLDSRCVVAALSKRGANAHTFNFARPNTQDQHFGRMFADTLGLRHTEVPKEEGDLPPDFSTLMAEAWRSSRTRHFNPPEHPSVVWSGEGGSVGLGHVHLTQEIVDLMRAGKTEQGIERYLQNEHVHISSKLIRQKLFKPLSEAIPQGIREELSNSGASDPARTFYLFLLLNDQRRKMAKHFEDIDLHRLEVQLPFFDSEFLELIISAPVEWCLGHKLYFKWLKLFQREVTTVPWQAYPGHEPCPLPVPSGLSYQWETGFLRSQRRTLRKRLSRQATNLLRSKKFPTDVLNRRYLGVAALAHRFGWRDYSYIIDAATVFHDFWAKCDGDYRLD